MPDNSVYAAWLWDSTHLSSLVDPQWLRDLETKLEDDPDGIRARRGVARRATSAQELSEFLDMLQLWPGQGAERMRVRAIRPCYNYDVRNG
jgi:hypothetical protein